MATGGDSMNWYDFAAEVTELDEEEWEETA
jgi:hypothetical protein